MHPLDPSCGFLDKHGVLIPHSLSHTGTEKTLVQILNPSPAPVQVVSMTRLGTYCHSKMPRSKMKLSTSRDVDGAIEQLLGKAECPTARDS